MSSEPESLPKDQAAAEGKVNVQINGKWYRFPKGTRIADACNSVGVHVPCFCYHPKLSVVGSCRMCLVEQGMPPRLAPGATPTYNEDGYQTIQWMPRAVIACANTVAENMGIRTDGALCEDARRGVLEFLLTNHPLDCPICDQAGECKLQEYTADYGRASHRFTESKVKKGKNLSIGPRVNLDQERCVLCRRCIRFMKEIVGEEVLGVVGRGAHNAVSCFPGKCLDSNYSMNVVDICPVGAMTSKDFRFKMRVWFLKSTPTIDVNCGTGTNINIWTREQRVYRITPRQNDEVNSCWMPDDHRLNYKYINAPERLATPLVRTDAGAPLRPSTWEATLSLVAEQLRRCKPEELAIIASARLTNEELYLSKLLADSLGAAYVDIVPRTQEADDMLVSADRNPNTTGAKLIFGHDGSTLPELVKAVKAGKIRSLIVLGEDVTAEAGITPEQLGLLDYLLVMHHSESGTTRRADVVLPGVSFAEKYGTMINVAGRIQRLNKAIEPLGDARADADILRALVAACGRGEAAAAAAQANSAMQLLDLMAQQISELEGVTWANIGNQGRVVLDTGVTIPLIEREKAKK
ncbi:MAG: molybdopterin-dependent oxidoreductase [Akkermansiaceae bacterium]|nr:molybdopterin-dependent oxidoreductase [Akkermansiaceae bacterium]